MQLGRLHCVGWLSYLVAGVGVHPFEFGGGAGRDLLLLLRAVSEREARDCPFGRTDGAKERRRRAIQWPIERGAGASSGGPTARFGAQPYVEPWPRSPRVLITEAFTH